MKFYTDPSYFFELWYTQIQNDITKKRQALKEKRGKRDRVSDSEALGWRRSFCDYIYNIDI